MEMFEIEEPMWTPPETFPDLTKFKYVAIDLETKDPELTKKGSGAIRGVGNIIGVAVAVDEGTQYSHYYPCAHEEGQSDNIDPKIVLRWIKKVCESERTTKIFHNAMYDVSWLKAESKRILGEDIIFKGPIIDTMVMISIIDENRFSYSLNSVAYNYLGKVKDETLLKKEAESRKIDAKSEMYKLAPKFVGPYAIKDAEITLELYYKLKKIIDDQRLNKVFKLETDLFPCLIDMKFKGVRVDVEKANLLQQELHSQEIKLLREIEKQTGIEVDIWAARSIAKVFEHPSVNVKYNRTAKSNAPSFTKSFLAEKAKEYPLIANIAKARELSKMSSTFIKGIMSHEHGGRIHADINPIRSDTGGTVTGRFSYANPNLQQMPIRNPELGAKIRGLFLPERDMLWGSFDYSQQEPRLVVHYAASNEDIVADAPQINEIVEQFKDDSVDFHQLVADMAGIDRKQAKTINLGLFYGMGKAKLQKELNLDEDAAYDLFDQYHERVPFVKALMDECIRVSGKFGEIETIGGRRCRFDRWQKNEFVKGQLPKLGTRSEIIELYLKDYVDKYPKVIEDEKKYSQILSDLHSPDPKRIKRAMTYKALNKLIQGSAADMTKQAMLDLYNEGIVPHIQIHDELDISVSDEKQGARVKEIMENVRPGGIKMVIPNKVDAEYGNTWGEIKG